MRLVSSIDLVFNQHETIAAWVGWKIGHRIWPPYATIGFRKDGKLCGGVVFNNWNGSNIEMTIALECSLNRALLRALHHYVFIQSKAERLSVHTRRSNKRAARLLPRLGFQFEGVAKRFYGPNRPDDALCYAFYKDTKSKLYG